jgi:hypothetical protein
VLHLGAVRIEDAVTEVHARRPGRFNDQDLVAPHPEATVRHMAQLLMGELHRVLRGVQHDEVVAGALHFGEAQFHEGIITVAGVSAGTAKAPPAGGS